ncbi:MAG TPA: bifunctional salicylyl-CoA 5-hydroxylase/oxidoreductase [Mycobacteriales bacterium]|nr:bifunctional salicylyl-CoA 5-hydroxylase/oxidoreductase [Mycobacteriales bacterium]
MRVACVGGGPGGLFLAILLKKADPETDVVVFERNAPDDTFGFGVVFSQETLEHIEAADEEVFAEITARFRYWTAIDVHRGGRHARSDGHAFAALSRRTLLELLAARAAALGVDVRFRSEVTDVEALRSEYDVVVASDGVNSVVRNHLGSDFGPVVDHRPAKYAWFGTTRPFQDFSFIFVDSPHGMFWAHVYPYDDTHSTFIVETTAEAWARAGLDESAALPRSPGESDAHAMRFCEELFAEHLDGHPLEGNNSRWLQFPIVTNATWHSGNVVLLGDAAHTAHFSVGSGTKLALEDAIALAAALGAGHGSMETALKEYEQERRPVVASLQRSSQTSLEWFEGVERYRDVPFEQFCFQLLTRSQRVTYDNLKLRDAEYVGALDRWIAERSRADGLDVADGTPPMFYPFRLRGLELANRIVVSPMAQYSAVDGVPDDWHLVHLGSRAVGGAALVFTEMTCVSPEGRITPGCTGLWNDEQAAAWTRIVDFVHDRTRASIGLQLGHSGRKGATRLMWEGDNDPLPDGAWEILAPSPLPYRSDSQVPREMTGADIAKVISDHVRSATYGAACGFDLLELHYAHGYLMSSFLSPLANRRTDSYGGSLENRARLPLEVFDAVRAVWPESLPISVRISATEWIPDGFAGDDAVAFARMLKEHGCDIVDVSTGQTSPEARPAYGRLYQTPYADRIRHEVGIPTMTVGAVSSVDDANTIVLSGRADLCLLARPHLVDPYWTLNAALDQGYSGHPWPVQYLSGQTARRREQQP